MIPHVPAEVVEAATRDSWRALFADVPTRQWDLVLQMNPEFIAVHRRHVHALLAFNGDVVKSVLAVTGQPFGTMFDGTKNFQRKLAAYLGEWNVRHGR